MKAKPIITALLLAFVVASVGYLVLRESQTSASPGPTATTAAASGAAVLAAPVKPAATAAPFVAYYFHGTKRCRTCLKIQAQSEEAIRTGLATELKAGRLAWSSVNLEEPGNEHFATDFKVTGSTLVIAEMKDTKAVRFAKLDKTWDLVHDKPQFTDYVAREVLAFIGGAGK
jgi:hypothetical protein